MVFGKKRDDDKDEDKEPFDKKPERPFRAGSPFDDFFGDFHRMDEMMNEIMRNMFKGLGKIKANKPYVYGFSMKTGPDGKPVVREFGNVKRGQAPKLSDAREPLVDIVERDRDIMVIAELPGVAKKDIGLEATDDSLEIRVDTPRKKYYKRVQLPAEVKDDTADATYNNGVLEVRLKRKLRRKKSRSKRIDIK